MLGWLVEHDINPHISVRDQSELAADGRLVRDDFTFDNDCDLYTSALWQVLADRAVAQRRIVV